MFKMYLYLKLQEVGTLRKIYFITFLFKYQHCIADINPLEKYFNKYIIWNRVNAKSADYGWGCLIIITCI